MKENPFLQWRQRVDVLHVRHPSRHLPRYPLDLFLRQLHQRQHLRRDRFATRRNQSRRNLDSPRCPTHAGCQIRQRGAREQRSHIHLEALPPQTLDQRDRQQRVSPEREEVIVPSHPLHLQHFRPYSSQLAFHLSLRRLVPSPGIRVPVRRGQRLPVQLPVSRQRQALQPHIRRRRHVLR